MHRRRAYTLIEMSMVLVVVGIVTVAAMQDSGTAAREQGRTAGECFEADVEYAQNASIARPDDPVVVKVDSTGNSYWLAKKSTPDTPISHPRTGKPYKIQFGPGGTPGFENVKIMATDFNGDQMIGFDATGNTDQQTPAVLQLQSSDVGFEVAVAPVAAKSTVNEGFTTDLGVTVGGAVKTVVNTVTDLTGL